MSNRVTLFIVTIGLSLAASVYASDNVREVQTKLSDEGFYFGEIDGAYSSELSAALSRYQIRNGLPITGQLDVETSEALGAKAAVTKQPADDSSQSSETWQRLRKTDKQFLARTERRAKAGPSPDDNETRGTSTATTNESREETATTAPAEQSVHSSSRQEAPPPNEPLSSESAKSATAAPNTASKTGSLAPEFSTERLRDYVAAFVLAGLDRNVGAEAEFFADRVDYYDSGTMDREKIRKDLKRYDEEWPERHFWIAGKITVEPETDNRVRVTFPLGFKLRDANKTVNGKVDKTLVLEPAGDDLQIVAVKEQKAE
jgi:peptidoglycan hydrolase-like protein with peptidoglycan-binding domain